jgi:hypothetical protein
VRVKGLEPSHLAAPDPKSGVSTNSTTPAVVIIMGVNIVQLNLIYKTFGTNITQKSNKKPQ